MSGVIKIEILETQGVFAQSVARRDCLLAQAAMN